ncbi:MAG: class II aldolase/adducin family protein [Bryobacterales bacterium]|nr:class II aldolase/adducin family protein [Bryobacterales bacterium]MBV9401945.1 class II aldolase/adducin family protein [Bryobacterales bacterium]
MLESEHQLRDEILRAGRLCFERGWIAASDGNVSARLPDGRILVTPAGMCKGMLEHRDLVMCDLEGCILAGPRKPSTELTMHLTVYRMREDVRSVVHAHPPFATGFAVAGRELNIGILPEVIVRLGSVPLARYGTPGTPELSEGMMPYVPSYDALLLANHGAVAWGEDPLQAFFRMDTVEHYARVALVAHLLGGARALPRAEIAKLFAARERYGVKSNSRFEPGSPLCAEDMADEAAEKIELTRDQLTSLIDDAVRAALASESRTP